MSSFRNVELSESRYEPENLQLLTFGSPSLQGRGLGDTIMTHLMRWLEGAAPDRAFVALFAAAGKAPFYERYGFKAIDRIPIPDALPLPHLQGNILMICDLRLGDFAADHH